MDFSLLEQDERRTETALDFFATLIDLVKANLMTGAKKSSAFAAPALKSGVAAHAFIRSLVDAGVIVPLGNCGRKGCLYVLPENLKQERKRLEEQPTEGGAFIFAGDNYQTNFTIKEGQQ